jgi:hypothetical protein
MGELGTINSRTDIANIPLIAEWNRADLTQFVSGGAADFSDGGATRALSVVNVAERGNVLRYSGGVGGATMTQIFMFNTASGLVMPSSSERRDCNVEIEIYQATYGGGGYFGIFLMGDVDTPLHGFGHAGSGVAEWQTLLNNGAVVRSSGTGTVTTLLARYQIRGTKPVGAPPEVTSYCQGFALNTGSVGDARRSGSTAAARGDASIGEFGNSTVLGATWNSISADRLGLIFQSSGGNPAPTSIDILNVRLLAAA